MASAKRKRQRANRQAAVEAARPVPALTDADLDQLLREVIVRTDCDHASTRTTPDGPVLTRCAVGADVAGGCPLDCPRFEKRRLDGAGFDFGGGR